MLDRSAERPEEGEAGPVSGSGLGFYGLGFRVFRIGYRA